MTITVGIITRGVITKGVSRQRLLYAKDSSLNKYPVYDMIDVTKLNGRLIRKIARCMIAQRDEFAGENWEINLGVNSNA